MLKDELYDIILGVSVFGLILYTGTIMSEMKQLRLELEYIKSEIVNKNTTHQRVTLTAYHPQSKGINSDLTPKTTATMSKPISGYTVAISKELVEMGWLGKKIYIDGFGVFKATDRMGISITGKHIDICYPTLSKAKKFGKKKEILAIVLE